MDQQVSIGTPACSFRVRSGLFSLDAGAGLIAKMRPKSGSEGGFYQV
jgi:hypothetical protein